MTMYQTKGTLDSAPRVWKVFVYFPAYSYVRTNRRADYDNKILLYKKKNQHATRLGRYTITRTVEAGQCFHTEWRIKNECFSVNRNFVVVRYTNIIHTDYIILVV